MPDEPRLLFLLGAARSGTKLLRDLLNNHRQVAFFPVETYFLPDLYARYQDADLADRAVFHRFYEEFAKSVFAHNMRSLGLPVLSEDAWFAATPDRRIAEVFYRFYAVSYAESGQALAYFGDKTPRYTNHLPLLARLFPDARFLHLVRDPRERALSERSVWNKSLRKSVSNWVRSVSTVRAFLQSHPGSVLEVRYEDLLENPAGTLGRILEYLDLPAQEDLVSLEQSSERYGAARGQTGVMQTNTEKFRNALSLATIRRLEEIAFPFLPVYHYPVSYASRERPLPKWEGKLHGLRDKVSKAAFCVREMGPARGWSYFRSLNR